MTKLVQLSLMLSFFISGLPGHARLARQSNGAVLGTVVTQETGSAIAGAVVTLRSSTASIVEAVAITDENGRFSVIGSGDSILTVAKTGYALVRGASGLNSVSLNIPRGLTKTVTLRMVRTGVLAGTISDRSGQPVSGALVFALDASTENIRLSPWYERTSTHVMATTDRRGKYRLSQLAPSSYVVLAQSTLDPNAPILERVTQAEVDDAFSKLRGGDRNFGLIAKRRQILAPTFYPGSPLRSRATAVAIRPAEELSGLDFVLDAIDVYTMRGVIRGVEPDRLPTVELALEPLDSVAGLQVSSQPRLRSKPSDSGEFEYENVPAGTYKLMGRLPVGSANDSMPMAFGVSQISVGEGNVSDAALVLRPAARVRGTVAAHGTRSSYPNLASLRLRLTPIGGTTSAGFFRPPPPMGVQTDGTFDLGWIAPGLYALSLDIPAGMRETWWFDSAVAEGREVLDRQLPVGDTDVSLRLSLTDSLAGLSGYVRDASGNASPDITVVLFASDRMFWSRDSRRVRVAQAATDGSYSVPHVPPGDYYLAAFRDDSVPDRSTEGLASAVSRAIRIRVDDKPVSRDLIIK